MADYLTGVALFILAVTAMGLFRVLRCGVGAERMMAVQLLGTAGAAAALLLSAASEAPPMVDAALVLVLLSAFSCAAFTLGQSPAIAPAASERGEEA